jgi:hypothetical protein
MFKMRSFYGLITLTLIISAWFLLSGCATICGGSRYIAHITVKDHPNANIYYQGNLEGKGFAEFKVKRTDANKFIITVKEDTLAEQQYKYSRRTFRGWACAGTILLWTGLIGNVPIPYGLAIDLATGAFWKPDITEKGIVKSDYKHYNYILQYSGGAVKDTSKTKLPD